MNAVTKKEVYMTAMIAALGGETVDPTELPTPVSRDEILLGQLAYNLIEYINSQGE